MAAHRQAAVVAAPVHAPEPPVTAEERGAMSYDDVKKNGWCLTEQHTDRCSKRGCNWAHFWPTRGDTSQRAKWNCPKGRAGCTDHHLCRRQHGVEATRFLQQKAKFLSATAQKAAAAQRAAQAKAAADRKAAEAATVAINNAAAASERKAAEDKAAADRKAVNDRKVAADKAAAAVQAGSAAAAAAAHVPATTGALIDPNAPASPTAAATVAAGTVTDTNAPDGKRSDDSGDDEADDDTTGMDASHDGARTSAGGAGEQQRRRQKRRSTESNSHGTSPPRALFKATDGRSAPSPKAAAATATRPPAHMLPAVGPTPAGTVPLQRVVVSVARAANVAGSAATGAAGLDPPHIPAAAAATAEATRAAAAVAENTANDELLAALVHGRTEAEASAGVGAAAAKQLPAAGLVNSFLSRVGNAMRGGPPPSS